jgi:hypothetical protein
MYFTHRHFLNKQFFVMADTTPSGSNAMKWVIGVLALGAVVFVVGYAFQKGAKAA